MSSSVSQIFAPGSADPGPTRNSLHEHNFGMRVLMTADTVGGVWNYSINLAQALEPFNVEFILATMGRRPSSDQWAQARACSNLRLIDSDFRLEWMNDPWVEIDRASHWLLQLRDKWQPDLIQLNNYSHASLSWQLPVIVVAHSCVLSWWNAVHHEPAPGDWGTYARRVAEGLRRADVVVAPSNAMLAGLHQFYHWNGPGKVIWNGIPKPKPNPQTKEDLILTVGRLWDEAKNVRALVTIAPHLAWPVYAAGESGESGGTNSVRRLGYLSACEIASWMTRAPIYALPARYEPFGLSILEAAQRGCALVLGDISSLRELWDGAAWFVHPDDHLELKNALDTLIANERLRMEFSSRACERSNQYGPEGMAQQYVAVYRQLVEDSRT